MLLRIRGSGFRGNDSFGSHEKAEGGIDNREDWIWVWYSCFSWGLEDIVRAGLLGITILAFTLIFLLRGLLRRNLEGIEYIKKLILDGLGTRCQARRCKSFPNSTRPS